MNTTLAIFDSEILYLEKLTTRLTKINSLGFDIHSFSDPNKYISFVSAHPSGISLVAEKDFSKLDKLRDHAGQTGSIDAPGTINVVILDEDLSIKACADFPHLDKYQPVSQIMRKLVEVCSLTQSEHSPGNSPVRSAKLAAFIGPDCGSSHLNFTISAAKFCARAAPAIYVNLFPFADLKSYFPGSGGTISDILYSLRSGSTNPALRISSVATGTESPDVLMPAEDPQDIKDLTYEDISKLIDLLGSSIYRTVLFDISPVTDRLFEVLELFDIIFVPVYQTPSSKYFFEALCSYLESRCEKDIVSKLRRVILPSSGRETISAADELTKAGLP